ncbi:MAG TPA: metal ABC transporter ATP-binding protein [Candidatus Eremiobacteraeota bacterium]|nr:MAG: Zinc import ATP-binding protein ZnuC [bacterium ADurb.Bin363]HPZ10335.1 metal ABC transporter ATP-binding protein [Candidatus Eremiobacteraeota bacterium]
MTEIREPKKACGNCCTKLEHINVTLGVDSILEDINLHVHCGEFTALIGPNGAGKSTLLKVILGEVPYSGKLYFMDSLKNRPDSPIIGYVPQKLDFDRSSPVSILDIFASALSLRPVWTGYQKSIKEQAKAILSAVEGEHLLYRKVGHLSGGELQRVLLALALSPPPDLLLLDEPVSGMDVTGIELFYKLLHNFRKKYDMSTILVSHNIAKVSQYVDRIIFLNNRRVICDGPPEKVLTNSKLWETFKIDISQKTAISEE